MKYANTLETMLAKQDIADCLARYARGVDRADADMLHSCYFVDSIEEHGSTYSGPARAYIDGAIERMKGGDVMGHYLCNLHVEFESDALAYAECYVLTFARFAKNGEKWDTLTGGRIVDRFEKRAGKWGIAHRVCVNEYAGAFTAIGTPAEYLAMMKSTGPDTRDKTDVSYVRPLTKDRSPS